MPINSDALDAFLSLGTSTRQAADQFEQMAEMAKKIAVLQAELNVITRMNEYVIEEMEP